MNGELQRLAGPTLVEAELIENPVATLSLGVAELAAVRNRMSLARGLGDLSLRVLPSLAGLGSDGFRGSRMRTQS